MPLQWGLSMKPILRAVAVLAAAATLGAAAPTVSPEEQLGGDPNVVVTYYDVSGTSYKAIRREMDAHGPTDEAGKRWAGHAQASYQYGWMTRSDGLCDLTQAQVSYKVTVLLPRLAPGVKLEGSTAEWWRTMRHNLMLHELDHVRLALGYAKAMEKAIKLATCATAEAEAKRVMAEFRAANARYDEATNHGTKLPSRKSREAPAED